jgi:hypothetical protein
MVSGYGLKKKKEDFGEKNVFLTNAWATWRLDVSCLASCAVVVQRRKKKGVDV